MKDQEKDKPVYSLDTNVRLVNFEKFIDASEREMEREKKDIKKKLLFISIPVGIGAIFSVALASVTPIIIGVVVLAGGTAVKLTKEMIESINSLNPIHDNKPKITKINREKTFTDELIEARKRSEIEASHFYNEDFEHFVNEEKAYREKHPKEYEDNKNQELKVDSENEVLNKDETMKQIRKAIDFYYTAYKIPPLEISDKEWDIFFDTTYSFFQELGIENEFYDKLMSVIRMTLSKNMVDQTNRINIKTIINDLYYMESNQLTTNDIAKLQEKLRTKVSGTKIVSFKTKEDNKKSR
ncbi:MAG: hypothetical protein J1F35_05345 [Erysipelotrichales bacterium]|nr:hypothetical protein [Erysipelotrichales bacterium]